MKIRVIEGREAGFEASVPPEGFRVGRGRDNDLVMQEEGISRHHCRICRAGGEWLIEDLNSMNGVTLNGERVVGTAKLQPGDRIVICRQVLAVGEDEAAVIPPLPVTSIDTKEPAAAAPSGAEAAPLWDDAGDMPKRRTPLVRILLLLCLLALIVVLACLIFAPDSGDETTAGNGGTAPRGGSEAIEDAAPPPREVSDGELAGLIAEEEDRARRTAPEGGPTPPEAGEALPEVGAIVPAAPVPPPAPETEGDPGRAPVTEEGRVIVSDVVYIASEPPGARVTVDGTDQGVTPLLLRDISDGRHRIELRLEGYEDLDRQIHVPDLLPARPYALRQKPGTLFVGSTVPGTAVWRGPQLLGVAPMLITDLPTGDQELLFVAPGCEPLRQTVSVSDLSGQRVSVTPIPLLGTLEVVTQPPGCTVNIEGGLLATTVPAHEGALVSAPLRIENLRPGSYAVAVEHPLGAGSSGKLPVKPGETVRQTIKLWVPDTRVVLTDGTVRVGMLLERNEQGDIVLAETPKNLQRYLRPQINAIVPRPPEEVREALDALRPPTPKPDGKPREKPPEGADPEPAREGVWGDDPMDPANAAPPRTTVAAKTDTDARTDTDKRPDETKAYSLEDISRLFRQGSSLDIDKRLKDRTITIRGVPTSSGKDGLAGYLAFGRRVRCYFGRDVYEESKDKLRGYSDEQTEVAVTGVVSGVRSDTIVLRECTVEEVRTQDRR
ncbi:MAG: PEGA domain-containing protein [Lentisphaeria bacterium]|nr:PEGA domain-containing protein [Lentisphaeria bacterium]